MSSNEYTGECANTAQTVLNNLSQLGKVTIGKPTSSRPFYGSSSSSYNIEYHGNKTIWDYLVDAADATINYGVHSGIKCLLEQLLELQHSLKTALESGVYRLNSLEYIQTESALDGIKLFANALLASRNTPQDCRNLVLKILDYD